MENPNITTDVKHSESKNVWNIIGSGLGAKYKIARIPYLVIEGAEIMTEIERSNALKHAKFISFCFNNSDKIIKTIK
jgi:hypothetical protein